LSYINIINYYIILIFFLISKDFKVSRVVIDPSPLSWPLYKASIEVASIENIIFVLSENFLIEFISFYKISGTIYPFNFILKVLRTIRSSLLTNSVWKPNESIIALNLKRSGSPQ